MRSVTEALLLALALVVVVAAAPAEPVAEDGLGVDPYLVMGAPAGPPRSGDELEAVTEQLASLMRCPVCQGLSVADSPTDSALAMKGEIRGLLAEGYSRDQVMDYFERSYGEFIRLEPKPEGLNWAVWIAPVAAFLAGLGLIAWRMRVGRSSPRREAPSDDLQGYVERVRREVSG